MTKPVFAKKQWFEVWVVGPRDVPSSGRPIDRRHRSKATAERIAGELRASKNYFSVWLVEVNRL